MAIDEKYIMGGHNVRGSAEALGAIYRVHQTVQSDGYSALNDELSAGHRKAREQMRTHPGLRAFFSEPFVEGVQDWDQIVVRYLSVNDDPSRVELWKDETTRFLQERGYDEGLLREYVRGVEKYSGFLKRYSFLY